MKRLALLVCLVSMSLTARPAHAYWDDVHFHLTYYEARLVGFTPEQAYRIAAAALSADYDAATEPGQMTALDYLTGTRGDADDKQAPRWKFHAFRNQTSFPQSVGNGPQAKAADDAVRAQAEAMFRLGVTSKNPGVFLHFAQDRVPHRGFGSAWGHYFDADDLLGSTEKAREAGLAIGGSTDWLSHHDKKTSVDLVYNTAQWLQQFMTRVSPKQVKRRAFSFGESEDLLDLLRDKNPAPPPLTAADLPLYKAYVAAANGVGSAPTLAVAQARDFKKHKDGPDLIAARDVVNAQMQKMGMIEKTVPDHVVAQKKYRFSASGEVVGAVDKGGKPVPNPKDEWTVVGSLKLTLKSSSAATEQPVEVSIKAPKTMVDEAEFELIEPQAMKIGESRDFADLPVGDLIVEVRRDGKILARDARVQMTKQENTHEIIVDAKPWKLRTGYPQLIWPAKGFNWQMAAGYPQFVPENGNWLPEKKAPFFDGYERPLVPGGTIVCLYTGTGLMEGHTVEVSINQTSAVIKRTIVKAHQQAQYGFTFTFPAAPPEIRPGDVVTTSLQGKASVGGAGLNAGPVYVRGELNVVFSVDEPLKSIAVGVSPYQANQWVSEGRVETLLPYKTAGGLDWGTVEYRFDPLGDRTLGFGVKYLYGLGDEGGTPTRPVPVAPPRPATRPTGVVGRWKLDGGGTIELKQQGGTVTGTYSAMAGTGTITGSFDGKVFNGRFVHRWDNGKTDQGPLHATVMGDGTLEAVWTLGDQVLRTTATRSGGG